MKSMDHVRRDVERMMRKFPSETVQLFRAKRDAYGQPTRERQEIAAAECWRDGMNRPNDWEMRRAGMSYEDMNAVWICLLQNQNTPIAQHEDVVRFQDGSEWTVRNFYRTGTRVYWQIDRVKGSD